MMTETRMPIPQPSRPTVTLLQVLRCQALGELPNYDASDLREFKQILTDKIAEVYNTIKTTNLFFSQLEQLRADVRWYVIIEIEIDALLAAEFHQK